MMDYPTALSSLEAAGRELEGGVLIKNVPEYPDCIGGLLDPRVRKNRQKAMEPKNISASRVFDLAAERANMGWPNEDVTNGAVLTEKTSIKSGNREIPVRIYRMSGNSKPCIVFFHGGGFFGGSLDCVENPCKCIAFHADCVVISVNYRLAPEHPFPQGFDDCFDVIKEIYASPEKYGIDKDKIGVCGDSAGGNLAAVCSIRDRNESGHRIQYAALVYPTVDIGGRGNGLYQWSIKDYDIHDDEALAREAIMEIGRDAEEKLLTKLYLGGNIELEKNEYVSPIFVEKVDGLPRTLIITAEYDFLRVEGEAYGMLLKTAGVDVKMIRYNGMDHAFIDKIGEYPQAEDAMKEIAKMFTKRPSG